MKISLCETVCNSADRLVGAVDRYMMWHRNGASERALSELRREMVADAAATRAVTQSARAVLAEAAACLPDHNPNPANDHPVPPSAA
jgi:hypothetical protein